LKINYDSKYDPFYNKILIFFAIMFYIIIKFTTLISTMIKKIWITLVVKNVQKSKSKTYKTCELKGIKHSTGISEQFWLNFWNFIYYLCLYIYIYIYIWICKILNVRFELQTLKLKNLKLRQTKQTTLSH